MVVELRKSQLKIISAVLANFASGLFLLPLTIRDIPVLISSLFFAIACLVIAVKIEDILEEL